MPDVTATSFGLVIAFLLPGAALLVSVGFWFRRVGAIMYEHLLEEPSGIFLVLFLVVGLAAGLVSAGIRWIIFEWGICRGERISEEDFSRLSNAQKLSAFMEAVDAHYRYHQFWGGFVVAFASLGPSIVYANWENLSYSQVEWASVGFLVLEVTTMWVATVAYRNYVRRGRAILREEHPVA